MLSDSDISITPPSRLIMSETVIMRNDYDKRNSFATHKTQSVIETSATMCENYRMISAKEILRLALELDSKAGIARVLELPPPRVTEMFKGTRKLSADEGKKLIDHYNLMPTPVPSVETCRLLFLHCANQLGVASTEDLTLKVARDLQAFLRFAASQDERESLAEGFLAGLSVARQDTPAPKHDH